MRARLIQPFYASIARINYRDGEEDGDFDDAFGEIVTKTVNGERVLERPEKPIVRVRCQIEDETFRALRMFDAGNSPEAKIGLVVDVKWLDRHQLLKPDGLPYFEVNDRLVSIHDWRDHLVHEVRNPPGLYCVEVRPVGYGLGRKLDLFLLRFNDRAVSQTV